MNQDYYVTFQLTNREFALPLNEILFLDKLINFEVGDSQISRNHRLERTINLIDVRKVLDLPTYEQEKDNLILELEQREKDHKNWIRTLEECLQNDTEFTLAKDPHKCKFGVWYDNFKTDDFRLSAYLRSFDTPHKKIHSLAEHAFNLRKEKGVEAALSLIEEAKGTTLQDLIKLFAGTYKGIRDSNTQNVIVSHSINGFYYGLIVDKLLTVGEPSKKLNNSLAQFPNIIDNKREEKLVPIIDYEFILSKQL